MATTQGSAPSFDINAGLQQLLNVAEMVIMTAPFLALTMIVLAHLRAVHEHRSGYSGSVWATHSVAGSRHLHGEISAKEFRRQAQAERRGDLAAH